MLSIWATSRFHVSRRRIVREVRSPATRDGVTTVYLLRSAQYQFRNCGVLYVYARRGSTCIEPNLGIAEGNVAKKAKKTKKTTGKKKKK
jgi:hypothetical protein